MRFHSPLPSDVTSQLTRVTVVETHPDNLIDLRVHAPFQALVEFAHSFDYDAMNSHEHGHVPAVVILVKAMESWRKEVSGTWSTNLSQSAERTTPYLLSTMTSTLQAWTNAPRSSGRSRT